jgi:hypothetical protein
MKQEIFRQANGIEVVMERFIGVKIVHAVGMTDRQFYGDYKGQPVDTGKPEQKGFVVRYDNGYESWCPWEHFWQANRQTYAMPFGHAIEAAKKGFNIARQGWNGKNQFVFLIKAERLSEATDCYGEVQNEPVTKPALAIKTTNNEIQVGWLASQTDMLSDDWMIVE